MCDLWSGVYREPPVWVETAEALIDFADLKLGMRVLDVGSAGGGTLFPALDRIGQTGSIVGIEVEDDWVEWLRDEIAKRKLENAENLLMNGQSMSFANDSFDAVIMGMVGLDEDYDFDTGVLINDAPLIREVLRVLKPGQILYISNWLWQDDNEWMGQLVRQRLPDCTKRGYFPGTQEGYLNLLKQAGFEDLRFATFQGRYMFAGPAEWMACVEYMWREELEQIKSDTELLRSFERDALDLLESHVNAEGRLPYTRSAVLVAARKPT